MANFVTLKLDSNHDIAIQNNDVVPISGSEAITQHVDNRFKTFLGEWFLDADLGVPWIQEILVKQPSFIAVQQILKGVVLNTPGILELLSFEFDFKALLRSASLMFRAVSTDGVIDYSGLHEVLP